MLDKNEVNQEKINADKVVGRDDNSVNNHYYNNQPIIYKKDLTLMKLLEEHEVEKQKDPEYQEFSDELNNFFKRKTEMILRDLETKLQDGNRSNIISYALESKENISKKIHKYSLYKSAQEVYTYLLTNIRTGFKHSIENRIKSGNFELYQIDDLVEEKIIEPFLHNVDGSSLCIDKSELYGLLYLLTGNCHIEWD